MKLNYKNYIIELKELGYTIRLSNKAKDFIAEKGFDKQYGARPLKRAIQRFIEDELAEKIVLSEINEGDTITIDYKDNDEKLSFLVTKIPNIFTV